MSARHAVVVGGGITGLAAAFLLRHGPDPGTPGMDVTVLEAGETLGGKIRAVEVAGVRVDAGADGLTRRTPQVGDLCRRLGLQDRLVDAATGRALVWSRGRLHPLPAGTVLGVPGSLLPLLRSSVLSPAGRLRAALEPLPAPRPVDRDRSVGALVRERFGREVLDRLVDPLLGGIHAGRADELSLEATVPVVAAAARRHRSLLLGLRPPRRDPDEPVLRTLRGGLSGLVAALEERLEDVHRGCRADRIERDGRRWRVHAAAGGVLEADAVVLAAPAPQAAHILADAAPGAAAHLAGVAYASVAIVVLAYPRPELAHAPPGSGFLVPACEGRLLKAATFLTTKWPHLNAGEVALVRCSVGRSDDVRFARLDDSTLVEAVHSELAAMLDLRAAPVDAAVVRWPDALPQYRVGHLDRIRRARGAVLDLPPLALVGAGYDGVGISSCVRQADEAARWLRARLAVVR